MDVLISGASIAGPALAYWLGRYGHRPTIVEIAPHLRTGGQAVDFRGPLHLGLLAKMGVLDELRAVQTNGIAFRFIDEHGAKLMEWPAGLTGGDLEVKRGDLARVLCEAGQGTEFLFGDRIAALDETPDGVDVTFASGKQRTFDLVIGADGVHSGVRRLTFGPEEQFVKHLGYYVATWPIANEFGFDQTALMHNAPGLMISAAADHQDPSRAGVFAAFSAPEALRYNRHDPDEQKAILRDRFGGMGWLAPQLLAALDQVDDLYFDPICRVEAPEWTRGRVALVGDAACGATIGGQGTGTAIVAAYVLAGELAAAGGDHRVAFPSYARRIAKFARGTQKGGDTTGRFLAPRTDRGLRIRNYLNSKQWFLDFTFKIAGDRSTNLRLPAYPL
ncbi:FAD-dependent monooxygenase [Actinoplanes sp. L3-i22]|uniref:FAD-dependent monooxygenase n=1 Tax=Actinoplanes sp. L3-i22 TaxID=2836373 RepID=UPI001C781348|nr:FAD-dependent monooxygenase [Actinoplanes sp. L3-i22]BCY13840.1 FAD-dependent oxidoreductase [Actinoplanes sp. L3-i22]